MLKLVDQGRVHSFLNKKSRPGQHLNFQNILLLIHYDTSTAVRSRISSKLMFASCVILRSRVFYYKNVCVLCVLIEDTDR